MTPRAKIIFLCICLLLSAAGPSTAKINDQAAADNRMSCLQKNDAQNNLRTHIARLRQKTEEAKIRLAKIQAESVGRKESLTTNAKAQPINEDQLGENPDLARLRANYFIADTNLSYGRYFHTLSLSPTQLEQLSETIARYEEWSQDHANRLPRNISPSDSRFIEFQRQSEERGRKYTSDLALILGSDGIKSFTEFNSSQKIWNQVGNVASALYASSTPLTAVQSAQLVQLIKAHSTPATASSRSTMDVDAVLRNAAPILSPLQLSIFTKQLTADKLWDSL